MPSEGRIIARSLKILLGCTRRETLLSLAVLIIRSLLPLAGLLLIRSFVDIITGEPVLGAVAGAADSMPVIIMLLIGAMALALLADDLLSFAGNYILRKQSFLLEGHISSTIHTHSSRLGLRYFEDPLFHDRLERAARDISWRPAAIVSDLVLLVRGVVSFIAMGYLLRNFGLIPLVIIIFVFIPVLLVRKSNSSRLYTIRSRVTADRRQASYFSWLLTGEKPAREVKLFGLGEYFDKLFRKHYSAAGEPELRTVKRSILPESVASLFKVAAFAGILVYATMRYLGSAITAGELAMYLVAFRQALVYLRDAVTGYSGLAENRLFLQDLFSFLDLRPDMEGDGKAPEPDSFSEISAENLTFTYPGATRPALQDINFRISRGEKIAVVGPNGSGKTTLVKLLCRLYDPDTGSVKVNGRDAASVDPDSHRRLFSVVFQNFMLYYLSAGENISLGAAGTPGSTAGAGATGSPAGIIPGAADTTGSPAGSPGPAGGSSGVATESSVANTGGGLSDTGATAGSPGPAGGSSGVADAKAATKAAAKATAKAIDTAADVSVISAASAAGISELLESLPEGYDTQLGHHTEGSRELSWGEWQKIAIARAVFRKSPVLILDEPSSSLDADSEYEIFSNLGRITGGRTCIFISHRLSNVRDADRIIVLDGGRIVETGTHDELMAAGGKYHSMFTRQKSMYR